MAPIPETCPKCARTVPYSKDRCRCGQSVTFPNRRSAQAEAAALHTRYENATRTLTNSGATVHLQALEKLVADALPTITMTFEACDDVLRSTKYLNYHERNAASLRIPATPGRHASRQIVGAKLYPSFDHLIHYAALSPDGRGLPSYGSVTLRWQVDRYYLDARISLTEDNSYTLYEEHQLGPLNSTMPEGYQSVWGDRHKLVVAKLAKHISSATPVDKLKRLILDAASSRNTDSFVEVAIYEAEGLDTQDVDMVTIEVAPKTPEEHHRWEIIKESAKRRNLVIVE